MLRDERFAQERDDLLSNLLLFTSVFYRLRTGRDFLISRPDGREPHQIQIAKALHDVFTGKTNRIAINCPPRYGKTSICQHFIAWCLAHNPSSQFIYVSYSHTLAAAQTQIIKEIISHPKYKQYFGIEIKRDSRAKDHFETTAGGQVYAAGSKGTITGFGAGLQGYDGFGGCILVDDIHKPDEVTSDTIRKSVLEWHLNTLQSRVNSPTTPIVSISQRLHEDDYTANLKNKYDGKDWRFLVIPALDDFNNALDPALHTSEELLKMKEAMPYEFSSQYQQDPIPAGGALFKPDWFVQLTETPKILSTFITIDTAETDKTYNDATAMSFFGLYKIADNYANTDQYALHWLDSIEEWVEPKDLTDLFLNFYRECSLFEVKPSFVAIEKKSTGTSLVSSLKAMRGMQIIEIERNVSSGSKAQRFIQIQPYVAKRLISLPRFGKHTSRVIEHMAKITPNMTHRRDDVADTLADGCRLAFVEKLIGNMHTNEARNANILSNFSKNRQQDMRLRQQLYGTDRFRT